MLNLVNAYTGNPGSELHFLQLPEETLVVYPSADSVVLLNARNLIFQRALGFWEAFPGARESRNAIGCLTIDAGMKLIVASLGSRVVVWVHSGVGKYTWRVHSSLKLPDVRFVTSLDCHSGLLAVGSYSTLSVFTLALDNDLPTWTEKWTTNLKTPGSLGTQFSPSLTHLATMSPIDNTLRVFHTSSGVLSQSIRHPRPIAQFNWRFSRSSSRDDLVLHTVTTDGTLRIYLSVVDAPHRLQLHASVSIPSSNSVLPSDVVSKCANLSSIFWLEKDISMDCFDAILAQFSDRQNDSQLHRIKKLHTNAFDFVFRALPDGSVILRAITNIDRRPPTLLDHFDLLRLPPKTLTAPSQCLRIFAVAPFTSLTLITSSPLISYNLDVLSFFNEQSGGLRRSARKADDASPETQIIRLVRTSEGRGVAILRRDSTDAYSLTRPGPQLHHRGRWSEFEHVVVIDAGKKLVVYSETAEALILQSSSPPVTLSVPRLSSLFCVRSDETTAVLIGITSDFSVIRIFVLHSVDSSPTMTVHSVATLPLDSPLEMILPVGSTPWSSNANHTYERDALLSVSSNGTLAFWVSTEEKTRNWACTGTVRTGRTKAPTIARCNSVKKTALVTSSQDGDELTIWDSKESEFASGLEYRCVFELSDTIIDIDWMLTPDQQHILAVGFTNHVLLLCQQRMTYFDVEPAWGECGRVEMNMTSHYICSLAWLTEGTLLVGAGYHVFQFGRSKMTSPPLDDDRPTDLLELVTRRNGPLDHCHPQMILQCLLWGKLDLVKELIIELHRDLKQMTEDGNTVLHEWSLPIERFLTGGQSLPQQSQRAHPKKRYSLLWGNKESDDEDRYDKPSFNQHLVQNLIERLEKHPLAHLTGNEHAHLIVLIQTVLQVDEQRRALDANGLRYLISLRSFYILNERASFPGTLARPNSPATRISGQRHRLRYRDMLWAFHSESQEILVSAAAAACGGKMRWSDARALGIFLWLESVDVMKAHLELIARNHYMSDDNRDPVACCIYYFALGKVKLVHDLWKQAAWHPEQAKMLKFLSNDFNEPRWRTAALKNGYALLSRQRFEYAAAFFLLGGGLKDAVNVCVKSLKDFQLAVALARIVERGDHGPVLKDLLTNVVVPLAFEGGNRWLGSWAFWILHRRDLAVRILVNPLEDVAKSLEIDVVEIGDQNYDDPSLALLFSQLKSRTLQTVQGASEISGETEFRFVLQTARVFCRMGCHALALDLVKSWSFDRPTNIQITQTPMPPSPFIQDHITPLPSPTLNRHGQSELAFSPLTRRRSSIMIDMDVPVNSSVKSSPPAVDLGSIIIEEPDESEPDPEPEKSFGSLMKSAKHDVQVPEFDMNSFW